MVVATLMAVKVATVWTHIVPIFIMCLLATVCTLFTILYFGRRLDMFSFERALALFGTTTGTAASGLLLLRIVDPEFKTPAAFEVGMMNVFLLVAIPISFVTFTLPQIGVMYGVWLAVGFVIVPLIILRFIGVWKKKAW
jgi:glutamate:Na+ symporter, ESS family